MGLLFRIFSGVYEFFQNLFGALIRWLSQAFGWLLEKLFAFLKLLFKPFLILLAILFYFLYKLAELCLTIFQVLLGIGKLFFAFVKGIIATIAGFSWTPTTPQHGSWTPIFGEIMAGLEMYQMGKIAYVILFAIWIMTAITAVKILSSRGGD